MYSPAFKAWLLGMLNSVGRSTEPLPMPRSFWKNPVLSPMNTTTESPPFILARISAPSELETNMTGIRTLAPAPPAPMLITPALWLMMMHPTAPALWAARALTPNSQEPRYRTQILPATADALISVVSQAKESPPALDEKPRTNGACTWMVS